MNNIIPAKLIDKAERKGACEEALIWLRAKPRTFRGMVRHNHNWGHWAITFLLTRRERKKFVNEWYKIYLLYGDWPNWRKNMQAYKKLILEALESAFCKK